MRVDWRSVVFLILTALSLEARGGDHGSRGATKGSSGVQSTATAAPTRVQIVVQGQDKQEQSNGALPQSANHLTLAWQSVSGATSYNIYRSVDDGAYTRYASVSASAATSAYRRYVSSSGGYDHQTDVDSAYQDTAATNNVGSCGYYIGNGVAKAPNASGVYFMPNVGYTYKVSAVGANGEGALSTDSMAIFFANGLEIMNHQNGWFNGNLSIKDTGATGPSPLGYTTNAKWTTTSTSTYINPFTGGGAVDGNFSVKGFKYLVLNVQAAQAGSSFTIEPEIAGDQTLLKTNLSSSAYGTLVANQWVQLKIPLSDLMVDQLGGTNAQQYAFYKITMDSHRAGETYWLEWYFSVN